MSSSSKRKRAEEEQGSWLELAEALLAVLPERPGSAPYEAERLDWLFRDDVAAVVTAAKLRPRGVKKSDCSGWPRVLEDIPITDWWTQGLLAESASVDERTIQRWEGKGLPTFGRGRSRRYPSPHSARWWMTYKLLRVRGHRIDYLPLDVALRGYREASALAAAGRLHRLR